MSSNQPEYDNIGLQYTEIRKKRVTNSLEYYTVYKCMLRSLMDDRGLLTGKRVLDLGCGDGRHTRQLKALACAYVLGVDMSPTMIELAREVERDDPKPTEYLVADIKQLPPPEQPFDLVTAFYVFTHARTREELLDMVRAIYAQLGENKRFIGLTSNMGTGKIAFNPRKYGFMTDIKAPITKDPLPDGTEFIVTFYNEQDDPVCTLTDYHYSPMTYEEVFKEVGFKSFEWVPFQCDLDAPDKAFFDDMLRSPLSIGIVATK